MGIELLNLVTLAGDLDLAFMPAGTMGLPIWRSTRFR
jgi:hypothetical protein